MSETDPGIRQRYAELAQGFRQVAEMRAEMLKNAPINQLIVRPDNPS